MSCRFPHQEESKAIKCGVVAAKLKKKKKIEGGREVINRTVEDDGETLYFKGSVYGR